MPSDHLYSDLFQLTDDLLAENRQVKLKCMGYSMFPFLKKGDSVTLGKCSMSEVKPGDIVVFKSDNKWVAHRAIKRKNTGGEECLVTRGDTCRHKDPCVTEKNFIGKINSYTRNNKETNLKKFFPKYIGLLIARLSPIISLLLILNLWVFKKITNIWKNTVLILSRLKFISRGSGKLVSINVVITFFQGIFPFLLIYVLKRLVDSLSHINNFPDKTAAFHAITVIIVLTGLVFLCNSIINILNSEYRERLSQSVSLYIYKLLHKKHIDLDISYLEDPCRQDVIHRAVVEAGFRPQKMVNESLTALQSVISWLFIAVILFTIHWAVFFLILAAIIPEFYVRFRFSKKIYRLNKSNSQKEREAYYYNRIITGLPFAKELRLFATGIFFRTRFEKIQEGLHSQKNKLLRKRAWSDALAQLFAVLLTFFSFGMVAAFAINGMLSVGTVVMFFLIFQRGFGVLKGFFQSLAGLYEDNVFLSDFFEFLGLPGLKKELSASATLSNLRESIIIDNISFTYPSSSRKALDKVSMKIPAGKTVALVGANGSGKTTLVKLLCSLYSPDSGHIFFDGINISQVAPEDIRRQITAVFQDFALYNMTAAENIYLGDINITPNEESIRQAAHKAGIDDIIESLPQGYNNMIGNLFEKGEELSIGQWQKMAIARAFYRNSSILFMDEPSSALDAETELNLLKNLRALAKEKTVLLISHRFSTIKWADIIYVMDNGHIVESGSHDELLQKKGKYYNIFVLNKETF